MHGNAERMSNPLARDLDAILMQTPDLWEPLRNCSLFITGGTGFVGTWLTETLAWADTNLKLGIRVVLLTRNPEKFRTNSPSVAKHKSFELLRGDCLDFSFPPGHFQYVIHAATESLRAPSPDSPESSFALDVRSTRRVLEFARSAGNTQTVVHEFRSRIRRSAQGTHRDTGGFLGCTLHHGSEERLWPSETSI
jgi:hypothetical protein